MEKEYEELIEAAPLLEGKLLDRREELKKNLILHGLSISENYGEVTPSKVHSLLDRKFGVELEEVTISSCLSELQNKGYLNHLSEDRYEVIETPNSPSFSNLVEPVWEEFSSVLEEEDDSADIYYLNQQAKPVFKDFMTELFIHISESFDVLSEHQVDSLYSEDVESVVDEIISKRELNRKSTFREILIDYLSSPKKYEELLDFTDKIYSGIVNIDLLSRERESEFPSVSSIPQENKKVFLDTNFIVYLLCETNELHPITKTVYENSDKNGFDILYLDETREELNGLIGGAEYEMDGIYKGDKKFGPENNPFVKDFRRKEDVGSWEEYLSDVREWEKTLGKMGIQEYEEGLEPNDKVAAEAGEILLEYEDEMSRQSIDRIEHDKKILGYVAEHRNKSTNKFGPFVLSFHNSLTDTSNRLAEKKGTRGLLGSNPPAIQARDWLNYLRSFSSVDFDESDRRQFSLAILSGATKFKEELSIREYSRLLVPKAGLESGDEEYLAEYLRNHPLSEQLKGALEDQEGHTAEEIAREILTDDEYRETIQEKRDFGRRIKKANSRISEVEKKLEEKDEKIEELKKRVETDDRKDTKVVINNHNQGGDAYSASSSEATAVSIEFNEAYQEVVRTCQEHLSEDIDNINIPEGVNKSDLTNPPEEDADIIQKKEWLQNISAVLTIADTLPDGLEEIQPQVTELLAQAVQMST